MDSQTLLHRLNQCPGVLYTPTSAKGAPEYSRSQGYLLVPLALVGALKEWLEKAKS